MSFKNICMYTQHTYRHAFDKYIYFFLFFTDVIIDCLQEKKKIIRSDTSLCFSLSSAWRGEDASTQSEVGGDGR